MTEEIEKEATDHGCQILGRIPYDSSAVSAQLMGKNVIEEGASPISEAVRMIWENLTIIMKENG